MEIGHLGAWVPRGALGVEPDLPAILEHAGFTALWVPGGRDTEVFEVVSAALACTERIVAATGVANIWTCSATEMADVHHDITTRHPGRFVLGLGVSHQPLVESAGLGTFEHPMRKMTSYLDELDLAPRPVPRSQRVIAALGERMLRLGGERSAGVHPYLVSPEHTARARELIGSSVLAPEQTVLVDEDRSRARCRAREFLSTYMKFPNYVRNWLRLGFDEDDLIGGGSDGLVDAIVAWGTIDAIASRVRAHRDAGADHVCVQVLDADRLGWGTLAEALGAC